MLGSEAGYALHTPLSAGMHVGLPAEYAGIVHDSTLPDA